MRDEHDNLGSAADQSRDSAGVAQCRLGCMYIGRPLAASVYVCIRFPSLHANDQRPRLHLMTGRVGWLAGTTGGGAGPR